MARPSPPAAATVEPSTTSSTGRAPSQRGMVAAQPGCRSGGLAGVWEAGRRGRAGPGRPQPNGPPNSGPAAARPPVRKPDVEPGRTPIRLMEDPALESVLQRLREALPEESTEIGLAIARAAFRRLPAKRTARIDPDEASAWLGEAVDLICGRAPGELLVRVTAAQDRRTLIEANVEDAPFLVSSVTEELDRLGLAVADVLHPIIGVERGADGRITRVCPARGAASRESYLRIELDTALAADARAELAEQLRRVLRDALVATEDFPAMRRRLIEVAERTARRGASRYDAHEVQEVVALLRWLADEHFLLLGARRYDVQLDQPS